MYGSFLKSWGNPAVVLCMYLFTHVSMSVYIYDGCIGVLSFE